MGRALRRAIARRYGLLTPAIGFADTPAFSFDFCFNLRIKFALYFISALPIF